MAFNSTLHKLPLSPWDKWWSSPLGAGEGKLIYSTWQWDRITVSSYGEIFYSNKLSSASIIAFPGWSSASHSTHTRPELMFYSLLPSLIIPALYNSSFLLWMEDLQFRSKSHLPTYYGLYTSSPPANVSLKLTNCSYSERTRDIT